MAQNRGDADPPARVGVTQSEHFAEPPSAAHGHATIHTVAIVVAGDETYGVSRFVRAFVRALVEQGVRTWVVAAGEGPMLDAGVAAGGQGLVCPIGAPPDFGGFVDAVRVAGYTTRSVRRLATALRGVRADAVFVRTPFLVALVAVAARMARSPSFWLLPNLVSDRYPFGVNKLTYDMLMRACRMLPIANSHRTRASLSNLLAPAAVAHLGIDPDEFDPATVAAVERSRLGLTERDVVIGIFARLIPFKGQKLMIEALAARKAVHPDLKLLVCGGPTTGAYFQDLQRTIGFHGLEDRVILTGPVGEVQAYYGLCDVVASVRLDPEPFGLSVIEGMLMAKPVLVHASGGPAETVADGMMGWHIGTATLEGFAAGLDAVFRNRGRWGTMGDQARRHALAHFTHKEATRRILAIVSEHIGRSNRR